ncbi:MAG: hypothetical protein LC803_11345 [Acidobacteria bacterium]|nr:hypothetical protein [Acidobacteriota bacterium]
MHPTLALLTRIAGDIQSDGHESLDALNRTIRDMDAQLFELELSLQTMTEGELIAA